MRMVGSQFGIMSKVQAGGGSVMVWGMFHWHTLGPLITTWALFEWHIETWIIIADHVHLFMAIIYPYYNGCIQHHTGPCHKAQVVHEHDNEFSVLHWPCYSLDLNPTEHLWDVVEQEICSMNSWQICSNYILLTKQKKKKLLAFANPKFERLNRSTNKIKQRQKLQYPSHTWNESMTIVLSWHLAEDEYGIIILTQISYIIVPLRNMSE